MDALPNTITLSFIWLIVLACIVLYYQRIMSRVKKQNEILPTESTGEAICPAAIPFIEIREEYHIDPRSIHAAISGLVVKGHVRFENMSAESVHLVRQPSDVPLDKDELKLARLIPAGLQIEKSKRPYIEGLLRAWNSYIRSEYGKGRNFEMNALVHVPVLIFVTAVSFWVASYFPTKDFWTILQAELACFLFVLCGVYLGVVVRSELTDIKTILVFAVFMLIIVGFLFIFGWMLKDSFEWATLPVLLTFLTICTYYFLVKRWTPAGYSMMSQIHKLKEQLHDQNALGSFRQNEWRKLVPFCIALGIKPESVQAMPHDEQFNDLMRNLRFALDAFDRNCIDKVNRRY